MTLPVAVMNAFKRVWNSLFVRSDLAPKQMVHLHHFASAWDHETDDVVLERAA